MNFWEQLVIVLQVTGTYSKNNEVFPSTGRDNTTSPGPLFRDNVEENIDIELKWHNFDLSPHCMKF